MARNRDDDARKGGGVRLLRVGENIRHALSEAMGRGDFRDPALDGVSVTVSEVQVSPDLRHASVFVMPLGGDSDGSILKALNAASPYFRQALAKKVRMKYLPKLVFKEDTTFDAAGHVDNLLRDPRVSRDLANDLPSDLGDDLGDGTAPNEGEERP